MRVEKRFFILLLALLAVSSVRSTFAQGAEGKSDNVAIESDAAIGNNYEIKNNPSSTPLIDAEIQLSPAKETAIDRQSAKKGKPAEVNERQPKAANKASHKHKRQIAQNLPNYASTTNANTSEFEQPQPLTGKVQQVERGGIFDFFGELFPLVSTDKELKKLHRPLNNLKEPLDKLREPIQNLNEPISRMQKPVEELGTQVDQLKQPLSELKQPIGELQQPIRELKEPINGLSKPVKELQGPITELKSSLKDLKAPVNKLGNDTRELSGPLSKVSKELIGVGKELTGVGKPLATLQQPLDGIAKPLNNLTAPITELPHPIVGLRNSVTELNKEVHNLQSEVVGLKQSLIDLNRSISFAVLAGAIFIGTAVLMQRKIPSVSEPTQTTVEQVYEEQPQVYEEQPMDMAPPQGVASALEALAHEHHLDKIVKTVMRTTPLHEDAKHAGHEDAKQAAHEHAIPPDTKHPSAHAETKSTERKKVEVP